MAGQTAQSLGFGEEGGNEFYGIGGYPQAYFPADMPPQEAGFQAPELSFGGGFQQQQQQQQEQKVLPAFSFLQESPEYDPFFLAGTPALAPPGPVPASAAQQVQEAYRQALLMQTGGGQLAGPLAPAAVFARPPLQRRPARASGRAAWQLPRVKPLQLTLGSGWQVDFGQIPQHLRVAAKGRLADATRARFRSYELEQQNTNTLQQQQQHQSYNPAMLQYTARGTVRPEQHTSESCSIDGVGVRVATAHTPYSHTHDPHPDDVQQLSQFASVDPDDVGAPTSMTLRLLPNAETNMDGHSHFLELSLNQAKSIMSGRPLTTQSTGPDLPTVPVHIHMVTVGC